VQVSDPGSAISILADKFYRLRDGLRILRSFAGADQGFPTSDQLRHIGEQIQLLARQLRKQRDEAATQQWQSAFSELDGQLDTFANGLLSLLERFGQDQLTTLAAGVSDRSKLVSLLDLCLDEEEKIPDYVEPIVFLVTHLSTEVHAGRCVLVSDPPYVSDRLGNLADRYIGQTSDQVCTWLAGNWTLLPDDENVEDVRRRMLDCRRRVRNQVLVPDVLRAVVELGIAADNRIHELVDAPERAGTDETPSYRDLSGEPPPTGRGGLPSIAAPTAAANATARPATSAEPASAGDAMELFRRALCARLERSPPEPGPAANVAERIELTRFNPFDRASLVARTADPIALATRRAILVGALLRHREEIEGLAPALGLDLDDLQNVQANEARQDLRGHVNAEIARGNYPESKTLGAVLNRHLPVGTGRRAEPKARARPEKPAERSFEVQMGSTLKPSEAAPGGDGADQRRSQRWQATRKRAPAVKKLRMKRVVFTAAILLLVLGPAQYVLWKMVGGLRGVSGSELASISPHLEDAKRSRGGDGPIMTGTLASSWLDLDDWERRGHAEDIQLALRALEVESATLFDHQSQLQVQFAAGRVTFVRTRDTD